MTRILMRAPHSPFVASNHDRALAKDEINTNAGNLLFPYSISRALMVKGVRIDYVKEFPKPQLELESAAKEASERYDCFVLPLANAFRISFMEHLEVLCRFIEALEIPCIVIGVGLQTKVAPGKTKAYRFDDLATRFMKAAIAKSDCVGIRGEATASYLSRLGFEEERDFTVIGCPSMYLYGADLPRPRPLSLSEQSSISINCKVTLPDKVHRYMSNVMRDIPDFHYIVQNTYEMKSLLYGLDLQVTSPKGFALKVPEGYPTGWDNAAVQAGRVIGFTDVPSWLDFLSKKDLSFGTRIHGNIAGVLAGAPTFIVAPDTRVLELAEYHNIPHIRRKELSLKTDVFSLIEGVDFSSVLDGHEERFNHYLDFLHRNGLHTVFDYGAAGTGPFPFDKKVAHVKPSGPIVMKQNMTPFDKWNLRRIRRKELA